MTLAVSVVVPTRDRPEALRRCLRSLAGQTHPPAEVIVIDDGSREPVQTRNALTVLDGATLLRLEGAGPAAARNAGARAARGDVICFTDDDCVAAPDWVARLAPRAAEAGAAAGHTRPAPGAGPPARATQALINHLQAWADRQGSPSAGFAPACNLAVTREVFRRVGFDESYPGAAGEDRDWAARAAASGAAPRFVPEAEVVHHVDDTALAFLRRQFRYGRGAAQFRREALADGPPRRLGTPAFYLGLIRAGFAAGPAAGLLVLLAQPATAAGVAAERLSRSAATRRRGRKPAPR